jgi:predicted secreted protein
MPCPELLLLGLDRQVNSLDNPTVMSEDTRIAKFMKEKKAQEFCKKLTADIIYQVEEYQKNEFEIVGLVGINGSPTCGVETTWSDNEEMSGYGEFIKILVKELGEKGIHIKMTGIKSIDPDTAVINIIKMLED